MRIALLCLLLLALSGCCGRNGNEFDKLRRVEKPAAGETHAGV